MEQMNIGNLFIEMGYGTNTTGKSQQTSSTASSDFFRKTLNGAKTSFEKSRECNEIKNTSSKNKFKYKDKEYSKSNDTGVIQNQKIKQEEVNPGLKEKDESKEHVDENQILILMSQGLNLSIDEIRKTLEQLGLEVEDLKSKEGFGAFISELYGQGSIAELLMNLEDVKSMTTLFEQLNSLQGETSIETVQGNAQQTQVILQQQEEIMSSVTQKELKEGQTISGKEVGVSGLDEAAKLHMKTIQQHEEKDEASNQNLNLFQEQQNEDIGLTVPTNHFMTTFIQKFEVASGAATQTTTRVTLSGTAVMEQIDFKVLGQTKEINLQLSPKELGDLNIKIIENNSALVAEIKVDNDKAKELILSELHQLKERLESQGLTITDVKVDIRQSNQKSQMEQERQKSSKRIQEIISKQLAEMEEEETISVQMTSEIDYMV